MYTIDMETQEETAPKFYEEMWKNKGRTEHLADIDTTLSNLKKFDKALTDYRKELVKGDRKKVEDTLCSIDLAEILHSLDFYATPVLLSLIRVKDVILINRTADKNEEKPAKWKKPQTYPTHQGWVGKPEKVENQYVVWDSKYGCYSVFRSELDEQSALEAATKDLDKRKEGEGFHITKIKTH